MVRPYYNQERGKHKQGEKKIQNHSEKLLSVEQDQKMVSEEHKGHANVQYQKL